jgi:hypothetical protein
MPDTVTDTACGQLMTGWCKRTAWAQDFKASLGYIARPSTKGETERGGRREKGGERERERVNKNVYSMYTECYLFIQQTPVKYLVNFKLYARDGNNKVWSLPLTCW